MSDCLFCKIVAKEIPADVIFEDDRVLAFKDINPAAPHHILVIPKKHIASLDKLDPEDRDLAGYLLEVVAKLARELGVAKPGYRTVINTNHEAGQQVYHIHLHLIAGRPLSWPPG